MRSRNIKPAFFMNADLADMPPHARLLYIGLWCMADREGRLEDRARRIRAEVFPYELEVNCDELLAQLAKLGFIVRYQIDDGSYIYIPSFLKHQTPHHKEAASEIPPPNGVKAITRHPHNVSKELRQFIFDRDKFACLQCGATHNLTIDHITPLAAGGTNDKSNLQTLCKSCNSLKSDKVDGISTRAGRSVGARKPDDYGNVDSSLTQAQPLNPESPIPLPPSPILNPESMEVGQSEEIAEAARRAADLAAIPKYAFQGEVCKVTHKQVSQWQDAFPALNVIEHIKGFDKSWAEKKERGEKVDGWFFALPTALGKANHANLERMRPEGEGWI